MFLGESTHTTDAKGRCFVPKRFQECLDREPGGSLRCVLARGFERCVFLFSESAFEGMVARLETGAFSGPKRRKMQRLFFSSTSRVNLDSSGRVLLPEKLKKYAELGKEVVMVGAADRAEIWNAENWSALEEGSDEEYDELDEVLWGSDAQGSAPIERESAGPEPEGTA